MPRGDDRVVDHHVNFDTYDVAVPWSDIPLSDTVEEGRYVLRVRELKLAGSREGKLMAVGFFSIEEGPLTGVGFPIQNYVLGTDDDPLCDQDPNTWRRTFGGRQLNQCLEACNIAKDERSLRTTLLRAAQARFQAYVTKTIQKEGDYAGSEQNRITRYAPYGQEMSVPGKTGQGRGAAQNGPAVPRSRMRPGQAQMPMEPQSQEGNDSETGQAAQEDGDIPLE